MNRPHTEDRPQSPPQSNPAASGFGLGTLFGVRIHVDWSVLIIFALIVVNLGAGVFPMWHPDWGPALTWVVALSAAILFFASVLAHELSHALVGRAQGIPIRGITLFIFGGMAHMEDEPKSPKAEFLMAAVGPLVSIGIGLVATMVGGLLVGDTFVDMQDDPERTMRSVGPLATLLLWLGPLNFLLGIFNLVPGFPLDGGRVARSLLWWATGDLVKSTKWASAAGQAFAWILMALGVVLFFTGEFVQGLWLLLIGWFLNNAARMSFAQLLVRRALENVSISRIMSTAVRTIEPNVTIEHLVREYLVGGDQHAYPVVSGDELLGLVSMEDVRRIPQDQWPYTAVSEIMTGFESLVTLGPDDDAETALRELGQRDLEQLPVLEGRRIRGFVRRRDLMRWVALQGEAAHP